MGRFLIVVIILVAIALLVDKYLLGDGDAPPVDANAPAAAESADKGVAQPPVTAGENAAAEAVPSAEVSTDLQQEAGVEPELAAEENAKVTGQDVRKVLPTEPLTHGDPAQEEESTVEEVKKKPPRSKRPSGSLPLVRRAGEGEQPSTGDPKSPERRAVVLAKQQKLVHVPHHPSPSRRGDRHSSTTRVSITRASII